MTVIETYKGKSVTEHIFDRELHNINNFYLNLAKGKYPVC